MRVACYEKNGSAKEVLRLIDVDDPAPGPGEVRVRLKTSGVNPSDVKTRAGLIRKMAFPRIVPHSDGAGEIDMVGAGVAPARKGERVWIWNAQWKRPMGSAAEYVVLPDAQAVPLPAHVSFAAGACLGIPALTAWRAVELAAAAPGATLLVSGGAGAVAHYAIQIAKARGAAVMATVSSAAKAKMARDAGADHTIDYKTENVGERVAAITGKPAGGGVDAIIELDLTANAALIPAVLRPRGKVVIYGTGPQAQIPASFCLVSTISLLFFLVYELSPEERRRAVEGVNRMLDASALKHSIGATFPFDQIVAAHEAQESGKIAGNIVLTMD